MLIQYAIKGYALIPGELYGKQFIPCKVQITPNEFKSVYSEFETEVAYDSLLEAQSLFRSQIKGIADDLLTMAKLNQDLMKGTANPTRFYIRNKLEVIPAIRIDDNNFYYLVQHKDGVSVKQITASRNNVYMTLQAALDNLINLLKRQ